MPIYDWRCKACGAGNTVRASSQDDVTPNYRTPPEECEGCGEKTPENFERVIDRSSANFVLKGDGWHRDEYTRTGRSVK